MSHTATNRSGEQASPSSRAREVIIAISGLVLGMFAALISTTVVGPSLPTIVTDLGGDQTAYTWIITASLLAMTVTTPIWGKLADLVNPKVLVQISLLIFIAGSIASGFASGTLWLIISRAVQGVGVGGMMALVQVVVADLIPPRERGKYMGVIGAVMGVGQVGGPVVGGLITDGIGWRWNFWVFVPLTLLAVIVVQLTLRLPEREARTVSLDALGAALLVTASSLLLVWISFVDNQFEWLSAQTYWMLGGALAAAVAFVFVELRASEPVIPLTLFRDRTFTLAVLASISVGVAIFGTSIFLSQYMQFARGATPTQAGLMIFPMVLGQLIGGIVIGLIISRTGRWKVFVVSGMVVFGLGLSLMGTIHRDTDFRLVSLYMVLLGLGVGAVMQNLVLAVQNSVDPRDMGAASSGVTFFRSLGGTIGVSTLGAVLARNIPVDVEEGLKHADLSSLTPEEMARTKQMLGSGNLPDITQLPEPVRVVVETAYGDGIAHLFAVCVPLAVLGFCMVIFLPKQELSRQTAAERRASGADAENNTSDA